MANNDAPGNTAKGKGKAADTDNAGAGGNQTNQTASPASTSTSNSAPPPTTGDSSLFSRIAQSAAGLSRDFVSARPSGGDLASLTSTDKAGPASTRQALASAAAGESSAAAVPTWASPSTAHGHAQQHATAQDAAFANFLDGADIDMSMPAEPIIGLDGDSSAAAWSTPSAWAVNQEPLADTHLQQPSSAVADQEMRDGLDVVNLLSADGPAEEEPDYGDIELAEDEIEALKRVLFGGNGNDNDNNNNNTLTGSREWDNVLNFIPDFVRPNPLGGYEDEQGHSAPLTKSHETQSAMGVAHSSESTRQWLDQWHDVLTRYNDEVWGGLSPLVAQAREEVDQLQQSDLAPVPAGTKALDRLRQILGHLRD